MKVAYARSVLPKTIFLAGPTTRQQHIPSWRPEAVQILERLGFDGTVFVPEDGSGSARFSYDDQIEWELQALHSATCVVFWVPRDYIEAREAISFLRNIVEDLKAPNLDPAELAESIETLIAMHEHRDMPAMTTNVEFGYFAARRNVVLGFPGGASKMKYLTGLANLNGIDVGLTLEQTLQCAVEMCKRPFATSPNYDI